MFKEGEGGGQLDTLCRDGPTLPKKTGDKLKDRDPTHLLSATCNLRISQRSLDWQRPRARGLGAPSVNKKRTKRCMKVAGRKPKALLGKKMDVS